MHLSYLQYEFNCRSHGLSQRVTAAILLPRATEYATSLSWSTSCINSDADLRHKTASVFDVNKGLYDQKRIKPIQMVAPWLLRQHPAKSATPVTKLQPTSYQSDQVFITDEIRTTAMVYNFVHTSSIRVVTDMFLVISLSHSRQLRMRSHGGRMVCPSGLRQRCCSRGQWNMPPHYHGATNLTQQRLSSTLTRDSTTRSTSCRCKWSLRNC